MAPRVNVNTPRMRQQTPGKAPIGAVPGGKAAAAALAAPAKVAAPDPEKQAIRQGLRQDVRAAGGTVDNAAIAARAGRIADRRADAATIAATAPTPAVDPAKQAIRQKLRQGIRAEGGTVDNAAVAERAARISARRNPTVADPAEDTRPSTAGFFKPPPGYKPYNPTEREMVINKTLPAGSAPYTVPGRKNVTPAVKPKPAVAALPPKPVKPVVATGYKRGGSVKKPKKKPY